MKTKVFISIVLLILVGIGVVIGYILSGITYEELTGLATVIERRSATEVVVELNEENDDIKNELIVYSNIFVIGDEVNIHYYKKGSKHIVNKVNLAYENESTKTYITSRISSDPTIQKYLNKISGKTGSATINPLIAMPTKLKGQEFNLLSEREYFQKYFYNIDINFVPISENDTVMLYLLEDFNVVSLENIDEDIRTELTYTSTNNTVSFKGVGKGLYSLKLSFKNEDIINFIFV